jgi:hypothetical protein
MPENINAFSPSWHEFTISFEVMLPSACSFIVDGLHGHLQVCMMFHFYIPEGIWFAAFVAEDVHVGRNM